MSRLTRWMDRRLYPGVENHWDDKLFRESIQAVLRPEHHLLDLGAGAGIVKEMNFRGQAARVCGVDPDERVLENPYLDDAKVGQGESIPYPDASFDVVVADNVLEHLENPDAVFREVNRVLKPGGWFLAKTPNRWHYMPLAARLTPHRFHAFYNRLRGRHETDTFPTRYRANSPGQIHRLAGPAGFRVRELTLVESRPEYLRISGPSYLLGWLYERLVNAAPALARFRVLLVATLQKGGGSTEAATCPPREMTL